MTPAAQRRLHFEALVIQLLWLILLAVLDRKARVRHDIGPLRGDVLYYFDEHGNQAEGAKAFRRETTFPEYHP